MRKIIKSSRNLIKQNVDYSKDEEFNSFNENFKHEYGRASFLDKLSLKKELHFIVDDNKEISGYVWVNTDKNAGTKIKSMYLDEFSSENEEVLRGFFEKFSKIEYVTATSAKCNSFIKNMGFKQDTSIVDMEIDLSKLDIQDEAVDGFDIRLFKARSDEWIRAEIQNAIFYKKNRTPLTVSDVELDMFQEYYLHNGSYFLTERGKVIGYGQLILMDEDLYLVNFGILYGYRNKGLGKYFLNFFLKKGKEMGFDVMKIKVFEENRVALKLYSGAGFVERNEAIYWIK